MPVPLTPAGVSPARRGHKKETTCGFLLLVNLPLSLRRHGENRRDETAPKRGTAEDFFFRRGAQCAPIPLPIRSARYSAATHAVPSPQARHKVNCPKGKRRSPGGYPCRATRLRIIMDGTCELHLSNNSYLLPPHSYLLSQKLSTLQSQLFTLSCSIRGVSAGTAHCAVRSAPAMWRGRSGRSAAAERSAAPAGQRPAYRCRIRR